jgi:hypothetical protein
MVISDGIPVVPRNRKSRNSIPNPSAEEKTTQNSVPWYQNRCQFSEFRYEPFRGREYNSVFLSVQQKIYVNIGTLVLPFRTIPWKRNQLILLDPLLQEIIAAMALLGSLLKWNRESVPRLEQSVRGYTKNFYNMKTGVPPTRGWMLKDSYMFGHSWPYKVQIDYLSPSEPK